MGIITLKAWAEQVGIDRATARQKAIRGAIPAFKIGREWLIEEGTPNIDHRTREHSTRWGNKDVPNDNSK